MTNDFQFDLHALSVRCWIIYKWSVNGLSVTTSMWFYSGLPWNDPGITYWRLIYLPRWLIPIRDGKVSLHPWEFTFMSSFITVWDGMACQCDLHNWILASVLWIVCSFTRWTLQSFWIVMKSEFHSWNACFYCFDVQPFKHKIPISFCKSSLWHLQHIPRNWFSIPDHVHDRSLAWVGLFGLLAISSRIKIIYGHLDDCSVLFQNRESGFYFTKILAAYTTKM